MQVTQTLNEGLKRGYVMTITAQELDGKVQEKLLEAQPEVEIKGFRKGKVPLALLKKQLGPRILGDAIQEGIDGAMREHFEKTGDRPALQPKVEMQDGDKWKEGQDVVVDLIYEVLPDVPDFDASKISLERFVVKADEAAIDEAVTNLAASSKSYEDRKKGTKSKDGDQLTFDFKGSVDGEYFEGGTAEDYVLVLGSNTFIPGFETQLIGAKAGDDLKVTVTFPKEYGAKHLAGKEAVFECSVKAVKAPQDTKIDDELAKKFGADDLAGLRARVAERLEQEYNSASRALLKRSLLDELDKAVSFELPPSLVESEASQIAHQLWHEENPEADHHNHGEITPTDEHNTLAERRVRLGLLLADIGRKAEIAVNDEEMSKAMIEAARQYPGQEKEFFEFVKGNVQAQQQLRAPVFEDKVIDHIVAAASVKDKEVDKDTIKKAVDALDKD